VPDASTTTSLDVATAIVAGYAAIVASVALAFQIIQSLRTWQTRVEVDLRRMMLSEPRGTPEPVVLFTLTNHSGHRVKVTHVGLDPLKRGGMHIFIPHPLGLVIPGVFEIEARDSTTVYITPDVLKDGDPDWKTRARISTSDGKTFRSKKVRLRELLRDA
jgi:hypothetical protein